MDLETVWLQVYPHKSNCPILTGAFYRPPSSMVDMDAKLELNIETAYLRNQEMYMFGDFNINFLDTHVYKQHRLASIGIKKPKFKSTRAQSYTSRELNLS